ncbi:hypothetical protein PSTT_07655 [Puccinia striiformis]|uniref:Mitochondrial fission process protein 1 n=1 Tax=Puccinia striiformis TaxID=27350 RepID=A0A2S4VFH8_9BASI|nr:hypothetical protein PSTT_07655 [Puccinia striiformis]
MPDKVENLQERIADGRIESVHCSIFLSSQPTQRRYLGLVARIRPLLIPGTRYLAYTSDIGEAFRPVVNSKVVTGAYGISIAYVVARRAAFQGTAITPLFAIRRSLFSPIWPTREFNRLDRRQVCNSRGLSEDKTDWDHHVDFSFSLLVGLGIIPFLPTLFDEPVEHFVDKAFDQIERKVLGQSVPERSDVKSK